MRPCMYTETFSFETSFGFYVFSIISHLDKIFDVRIDAFELIIVVLFIILVNNSDDLEGVQIIAILARFPGFIERIPCSVVINKGGNVEHFTYPIICHIYIGICVINEGTHLRHDVIPSACISGEMRKDRSAMPLL